MLNYNQAFWFSFLLYMAQLTYFLFGAMAFVKYLMKRDK